MPNWFKFHMDGWQWGGIDQDMTLEQRAVYLELVIIVMRGWRYPFSLGALSTRLGCSKELVDETAKIAINTSRMAIDDKGVLYMAKEEFAEPAPITRKQYTNGFNKELKDRIRKRDKYTCQNCGITEAESKKLHSRKLTIHHINYIKPDLDDYNLISLCNDCHVLTNTNRAYWQKLFTDKLNGVD
jgi:hypothetical protein